VFEVHRIAESGERAIDSLRIAVLQQGVRCVKRLLVICTVFVLASSCQALAAMRGEVGGPPTRSVALRMFMRTQHPTSRVIVIGREKAAGGRIELLAYDSPSGLCMLAYRPKLFVLGQVDPPWCDVPLQPPSGAIAVGHFTSLSGGGKRYIYSDQEGVIRSAVGSVALNVQVRGSSGPVAARVGYARPGPVILARLHQPEPFSVFLAVERGCALISTYQATAFDYSGAAIGSQSSAFPSQFDPCA
jgi:hypothetical protein